jgi:NitT/TauT family transport system permease protein
MTGQWHMDERSANVTGAATAAAVDGIQPSGTRGTGPPCRTRRWRTGGSLALSLVTRLVSRKTLVFLVSIGLGFGLWSLLATANPKLVPTIGQVIARAYFYYNNGSLIDDIVATLTRVLAGFAIGSGTGIIIGVLMGWYRPIKELIDPWIQFFRMIPALALIPVVIVYLGIGENAKVFVIALSVFLTVVIAAFQGVREADPLLIRAARTLGANDRQLFVSVVLPGSIPYILVGLRIGLAAGWTTVVAAELIAAQAGLGYLVQFSGTYFDMAGAYVAVALIGILGLLMNGALVALERVLTRWQERVAR